MVFTADDGLNHLQLTCDESGFILNKEAATPQSSDGDNYITRGLIDIQVNGFAGVDFNRDDLTKDELETALTAMLKAGVTTCLPTIITGTPEQLLKRFTALDRAISETQLGDLMVPGYHLEGPFLSPLEGFHGAHPPEAMSDANWSLIEKLEENLTRPILIITIAAEVGGAEAFIKEATSRGKIVSIGHSNADAASLERAVAAGAKLSTHLGNGQPQMLPRLDNPVLRQLGEDRLNASFIPDGIHIPPTTLKSFLRAKGLERSIIVTDASTGAACPPGIYQFAGMEIEVVQDGSVRKPGEMNLAGSALALDQGVRNLIEWGFVTPREAIRLASANPAALLAPAFAAHGIKERLSLVEWSSDWKPQSARIGTQAFKL
ncbi:N-acetylglucosamine-6-phosphate deacetylase [Rhodobacteraceae bacterium RKSG542]|uniref:N-acetylglucosamine-6-phosphate deacetylase n=1 Tax=Pseudovibrio flavus TaxID=2529854 RepID=UPI0012BCDEF5|nr:amidohydrolase family protein [Pseudovibrio flavus]MTI18955.1 N-acetylglucosamine-6-phosphate deacetylase [Pseudovibrio flavus]